MNYDNLNSISIIPSKEDIIKGKFKVERVITIDKSGHVILPSEDFKNYIVVDIKRFIDSLEDSDSIYFDEDINKYKVVINGIEYILKVNKLYRGKIDKRILKEKKEKIINMILNNTEFPIEDEEIDLYDTYIKSLYKHTKAETLNEATSILNSIALSLAGATGAIYTSAYVKGNGWAFLAFIASIGVSCGGLVKTINNINFMNDAIKRKKKVKKQMKYFNTYLDDINYNKSR